VQEALPLDLRQHADLMARHANGSAAAAVVIHVVDDARVPLIEQLGKNAAGKVSGDQSYITVIVPFVPQIRGHFLR
jgi:hypothetical protein